MTKRTWTDEQLIEGVRRAKCASDLLQLLGLNPRGGNFQTIRKHLDRLDLDSSHWSKGSFSSEGTRRRYRTEEILVKGSSYANSSNLKSRLWKEGLLKEHCYECGLTEWLGRPAPLELEHINGDKLDNRLENLSILCPNCHAFTSTYRGKNGRWAGTRGEPLKSACGDCGLECFGAKCMPCSSKSQERIEWPAHEVLVKMVAEGNYAQVGRRLGVSDNAVRKRMRNHGGIR